MHFLLLLTVLSIPFQCNLAQKYYKIGNPYRISNTADWNQFFYMGYTSENRTAWAPVTDCGVNTMGSFVTFRLTQFNAFYANRNVDSWS